ncbi:hypothetical protein [Actinoallomurus sp. CA-142502]|uniref:hypothetical protein n=1 Tax=Actinoallomurus sp. CA-142502 TaxID=3239885 RepID=UPI003D8B7D29
MNKLPAEPVDGQGDAMTEGRIWFPGNPWPDGHRIAEFRWTGWLSPEDGAGFGFSLKSAPYDEDDRAELDGEEDHPFGGGRATWRNYGWTTIDAMQGFVAGTPDEPLDFGRLSEREFHVDPLDQVAEYEDHDDYAFHVYLLGHDSVADHRIRFPVRQAPFRFDIAWNGRVALTYIGETEFEYEFRARVSAADFTGFELPRDLNDDDAQALLARCVRDADAFRLDDRGSVRRFVPAT